MAEPNKTKKLGSTRFERFKLKYWHRSQYYYHAIGYGLLVAAVIVSFAVEREHYESTIQQMNANNKAQQVALAKATQQVFIESCENGNLLRISLQNIMLTSINNVKAQEAKGVISESSANQSIGELQYISNQVKPLNCQTYAQQLNAPAHTTNKTSSDGTGKQSSK